MLVTVCIQEGLSLFCFEYFQIFPLPLYVYQYYFSFVLNQVFVGGPNRIVKETKLVLFRTHYPPLNSRVNIKQILNFFSTLVCFCCQLKTLDKINEKILCWFIETSINILRLTSNAPPQLLLICRQIQRQFSKTNTVI